MRDALLFQFIADRAYDLAAAHVDVEPPPPFAHADVHLLASALQKAVRRGDLPIARRAGHQLHALDRQRLWRRLAVIALEDIGIASIETVADVIAISALRASRRLLGGDIPALDIALTRACAAVKDRTGDHLGSIINREPVDEMDRVALHQASPHALLAVLASSDLPWTRRLHAGVLAAGRSDGPFHPSAPNIGAVFDVLLEMGAPSPLVTACQVYAARQRDLLPVCVPFASVLAKANHGGAVARDLPPSEQIGELPDFSFDPLHTRLGRRAVDLWLRSYLMKQPWLPRQAAAALWNAESAACDRTLDWSMSDAIRERAHRSDLLARGVPCERHDELMGWIARERPALNAARTAVWNSVRRLSGEAAEALEQANLPLPVPGGWSRRG
ncbi:MAG: hypothetical protein RB191_11030 [Terriglobia bacterium]|nr:hypothetical protein [Terriglobia bacterium]